MVRREEHVAVFVMLWVQLGMGFMLVSALALWRDLPDLADTDTEPKTWSFFSLCCTRVRVETCPIWPATRSSAR